MLGWRFNIGAVDMDPTQEQIDKGVAALDAWASEMIKSLSYFERGPAKAMLDEKGPEMVKLVLAAALA
jgi:hypothetical protein